MLNFFRMVVEKMRSLTGILLIVAGAVAALAVGWFFFSTTSDENTFHQQTSVTQADTSQNSQTITPADNAGSDISASETKIDPQEVSPPQPALQPGVESVPFSQSEIKNQDKSTEPQTSSQQADDANTLPEITIARVDPDGNAVLAGKAVPRATVIVSENGKELGRTKADDAGEWVIVLEEALAQGNHLLIIEMQTEDGVVTLSERAVLIELSGDDAPLVAIVPMGEAVTGNTSEVEIVSLPKTLEQQPKQETADKPSQAPATLATTEVVMPPQISIFTLSWRSETMLAIKGEAISGDSVIVSFAGNQAQAELTDSSWLAVIDVPSRRSGLVRLEASLFTKQGGQVARASLNIDMSQLDVGKDGSDMVVVQKGDMLWRIAYRTYGSGIRYLDIVKRNQSQIDDPDLIYPTQIFSLPAQ